MDARRERRRQDPVGEMVRKGDWVTITASGKTVVVTPSGIKLGNVGGISEKHRLKSFEEIFAAWEKLSGAERSRGQQNLGTPDPERPLYQPPEDALIIRVFNRHFEREADGSLRYTIESDYAPGEGKRNALRFRESAQDMMWIPAEEWKAFVPKNPQNGQSFPAPASFTLRLFRYHLDPERGLGEGITFRGAKANDGQITLTIDEVNSETIHLRLRGFVNLVRGRPGSTQTTYEPALLGYITCNRRAQTITRFDLVALGEVLNTPRGVRPGLHSLGIASELVTDPTIAERVVPRGGRDHLAQYLHLETR